MNVLIPIGTRPEIVKLAPIVHLLSRRGFSVRVIATGQHDDPALSDVFFDRFALRPHETWSPPKAEDERVGYVLTRAMRELRDRRPDAVLIVGDTYTVPLFCVAARRFRVPIIHVEAGLRSFNPTSMEEVNRQIAGQAASLHFAPTRTAAGFLEKEGVESRRIHVVGNPVIDALCLTGVKRRSVSQRSGIVFTAHRAGNVDDVDKLHSLVDVLLQLADEFGPVTFPVHPRTKQRLVDAGEWSRLQRGHIRLFSPVLFDVMVEMIATSKAVVSDSGGLQEEAAWLGVPFVVLRPSTPRWEGVASGIARLAGLDVDEVLASVRSFMTEDEQHRVAEVACPYGDGQTAQRIADVLADGSTAEVLEITEPNFVGKQIDILPTGQLLVG